MAKEKRDVEIKSRADTIPLTSPDVRPWPVTPPPPPEEVTKVYEKRKAGEFGKWCEDNLRFEKGFGKPEALQGLRVLDIGLWRMGHKFASSLLAEAGAEVICIEPPGGDPMRKLTPFGREEYMLDRQGDRGEVRTRLHQRNGEQVLRNAQRRDRGRPGAFQEPCQARRRHRRWASPRLHGQSRDRVQADLPDQPETGLLLGGPPRVVGLLQGQGLQARPVGARSLCPVHELLRPQHRLPPGPAPQGEGGRPHPVRALDHRLLRRRAGGGQHPGGALLERGVRRRRAVHRVHRGRVLFRHPRFRHQPGTVSTPASRREPEPGTPTSTSTSGTRAGTAT